MCVCGGGGGGEGKGGVGSERVVVWNSLIHYSISLKF